ncbi:MAG TPA: hypothetical protein VGR28_01320, partial [Candidatus Thermoplasmatota archaeon]|nr:hypothetical protein [Candidatus Thermoplasmatota archaeon]
MAAVLVPGAWWGLDDAPGFQVQMVSSTSMGTEPTASYAADGRVWYGAMAGDNAALWSAPSDLDAFAPEPDPPTDGGMDGIVHIGFGGLVFFGELDHGPGES